MPFHRVRDINVYYEIQGTGPHVLFITGTGSDLRRRPNFFDEPLSEAFTVLALDQRGLGQTDRPEGPYTMQGYAEDVNGLLDVVGWERCPVIGYSFGGMVGQEFACRFPHRVERLVLCGTSSGGAGRPSYPLHTLLDLPLDERLRKTVLLSDVRRDETWQREHADEFERLVQERYAKLAVGADEPRREEGARLQLEARSHHDTYDRLPSLQMPALICGGRSDGIAPAKNHEALARQIPHARLALFEGGHAFLYDNAEVFPRIIRFLRGELDGGEGGR